MGFHGFLEISITMKLNFRAPGVFENVDVLVLPTTRVAAQKVTSDPVIDSKDRTTNRSQVLGSGVLLTTTFSLASIPALSINCGFTSEDLPIGLQIGGRPFAEETVFKVAHAYEQAAGWRDTRAGLS